MKLKPLIFTSRKFLLSKNNNVKLRNVIAGIAFAMIPLVLVHIVTEGMIFGITQRYIELGTYHYQIKKHNSFSDEELIRLSDLIYDIDGVKGLYPERDGIALFSFNKSNTAITVRGLSPDIWEKDEKFREYLEINNGLFDLEGSNNILVSKDLAESAGVKPGDRVKIITTKKVPDRAPLIRPVNFTVTGIVSTGYFEVDSLSVYISYVKAVDIFPDKPSFIGLKKTNPEKIDPVFEEKLKDVLYGNWYFSRWSDQNRNMFKSYSQTKFMLLLIMSVILVIAAVNISSSVFMLIMEKSREIAILKSSGATKFQIVLIFSSMSTLIGIIGVFFGMIAGLLVGINVNAVIAFMENITNIIIMIINTLLKPFINNEISDVKFLNPAYYLEKIPIVINLRLLVFLALSSVFLSFLAGMIPGLRAGKMKPVEIFQRHN